MTCGLGKICYASLDEIREKLPSLRKKKGKAKSYWCPDCGAYHVTTKKKTKPYDRPKEKNKAALRRRLREESPC